MINLSQFQPSRSFARTSQSRDRRRWAILLLLLLGSLVVVTASLLGDVATRGSVTDDAAARQHAAEQHEGFLSAKQWAFDGGVFESMGSGGMRDTVTQPTALQRSGGQNDNNEPTRRRVVTSDQPQPSGPRAQPSPAGGMTPTLDQMATGPNRTDLVELRSGVSGPSGNGSIESLSNPFFSTPNDDDPGFVVPTPSAAVTWLTVVAAFAATRRRRRV